MSPQIAEFARQLRDGTREGHRALDRHPLLVPLTRTPLSQADYGRALAALHGPHRAIEAALGAFAPAALFPPRLPDLDADLARLGRPPCPLRETLPATPSDAARLGMLYVIEGSNMGSATIARLLAVSLPAALPRRFFCNAGGAARWHHFWEFAGPACSTAVLPDMLAGAQATFAFYRRHLDACLAAAAGAAPAA